jgi:hypothetical protein
MKGFGARGKRGIRFLEVQIGQAHAVESPRVWRALSGFGPILLKLNPYKLSDLATPDVVANTPVREMGAQRKELRGGIIIGEIRGQFCYVITPAW